MAVSKPLLSLAFILDWRVVEHKDEYRGKLNSSGFILVFLPSGILFVQPDQVYFVNKQAEPEQPQQPEETQEPKYIEDAPPPPVPQLQPTSGPPPTAGLTQPSRVPIATLGGVSQSSAAHQQSVPSTAHSEQGNCFDTLQFHEIYNI